MTSFELSGIVNQYAYYVHISVGHELFTDRASDMLFFPQRFIL